MPSSAEILTAFESCQRRGLWTSRWEGHRMTASEMVRRSVTAALVQTERDDYGEYAGEELLTLARDRGMECANSTNLYRSCINHAAMADIITTAVRRPNTPAWQRHEAVRNWIPSSFLDPSGNYIRRFIPVSTWSLERERHETRSWYGIGEVCNLKLPMQAVVAIMGPMNGGRRHGHWSKALLHPNKSSLRFKLRSRSTVEGFRESWTKIFREEFDQISRERWLQCMADDDVLREVLFVVNIPVPGELEAQRIRDMADRKMEAIAKLTDLPEKQLSTCESPLGACPFLACCHSGTEFAPSKESGFDEVFVDALPIH